MQSYDKNDETIWSKLINAMNKIDKEMNDPDVAYVKVGKLPHRGDEVIINGLKYKAITGSNQLKKTRQLILELL